MTCVRMMALVLGLSAVLGLAGCGNSAGDTKAQSAAFAGKPDSPEAKAAAQRAIADSARQAAEAKAAAAASKPAAR